MNGKLETGLVSQTGDLFLSSGHRADNSKVKLTKRTWEMAIAGVALLGLAPAAAHAALAVSLHKANTSVGVLPTNSANKWKLQTDPAIQDPNVGDYIPINGSLSNSFDSSIFHLAKDASGNYSIGDSVNGFGAYQVTAFDVLYTTGGQYDVSVDPTNPAIDDINIIGDVSGTESGVVDNIAFQLIPDRKSQALPADQDQIFYELNLLTNNEGGTQNPGVATTFAGPNDFITIGPTDPNNGSPTATIRGPSTDGGDGIVPSTTAVPEPATASVIIGIAGMTLSSRPRKRKA